MIKFSTGLRNKLLGSSAIGTGDGLGGIFYQSFIDVYTGAQPTCANKAPTGTLLGTYSVDGEGDGLSFAIPADGVVSIEPSEELKMTALATGMASWFRLRTEDDTLAESTTLPRLDGTITSQAGTGDLRLYAPSMTLGGEYTLESFRIALAKN